MRVLAILIVLVIIIVPIFLFTTSAAPAVQLPEAVTAIGRSTTVTILVVAPHGVREMKAYLEQNGVRYSLGEQKEPTHRVRWPRHVPDSSWTVIAGTDTVPQLADGKAQIVVEATSNDFRAVSTRAAKDIIVVTRPPTVAVDSDQHYLYRGMADLVSFNVGGSV